jgi:lysyl-tRNA synthetase class 2
MLFWHCLLALSLEMPSTVISSFSYDADKQILRVRFLSGISYDYKDVPADVYEALKVSRTKGIYFNNSIKNKFEFERIDDQE